MKRSVMRLNPQQGDKFIGRPQGEYDLPFTVLSVGNTGVYATTDRNGVTMRIPRRDWNEYIANKTITKTE